ncbi:MAG: DUF4912 domain-containing protein [Candidatus Margulisiibacteriota bacterium]
MPVRKRAVKTAKDKPVKKTAAAKKPAVPRRRAVKSPVNAARPEKLRGGGEERVEESKYYAGPVMQKIAEEKQWEFPGGYDENRIVLMVRDPHWLYAYWEVNGQRRGEIAGEIGADLLNRSREVLRVYETASWQSFDVLIDGGARSWYIKVPEPNRTYCVDIGFLTPDGRFIAAARSNWVTTPLDRMSDVIDEQWLIPDWEKMYALSGGFGLGRGSEEIREMMRRRLEQESASGWISSMGSPVRLMGERPFWLAANCELIVYGATEPSATVTVQGHKIELRPDGTFSLRFALPDGNQVIPIEAIRDDGAERRKITPKIERKTD